MKQPKCKLFIFDFDGTALGGHEPYARFPDGFAGFLDEIAEKGIRWATNTTWHPKPQDKVFRASALKSRPVRSIGRTGLACGVYIKNRLYLDADWDARMLDIKARYTEEDLPRVRKILNSYREITRFFEWFDHVFDLHCADFASVKKLVRKISADRFLKTKFSWDFIPADQPDSLTITPYYMSKGEAVRKIQKQLKITPGMTMVAGDGLNDLTMFDPEVARFQVAPANAHPAVKQAVLKNNGLVGTLPYSDGVAQAARKIMFR